MLGLNLELPTFKEIQAEKNKARQTVARQRLTEYRRRRFEAALHNRLTTDWIAPVTSINAELRQGLRTMRARSRELAHNDGYMKKFLSMARSNIIGPRGIRLQLRATKNGDELDTVLNAQVETAWAKWSNKEYCSASQKLTWLDAQNLAITQMFRDGECLIRKVTADNPFGFALKFIDVAYLDETYNTELPDGNRILMSVEVDQDERAVAYYLTTPYYDTLYPQTAPRSLHRVRVPASEIIYLPFFLDDESATRSAPASHAAMRNLRELGAYLEAKVIASRVEACQMGFLIPPQSDEDASPLDESPAIPSEIEAQPAIFPELPPGYDMKMFDPKNPNGQEGEFIKAMLKGIAVGFDVDYPTFASDLREVNFSSIRAGIQEAREVWRMWQGWFSAHLHREVYLSWLRSALMSNAIEGVLARDFERMVDPRWLPRGWGYVNPLQDVEADAKKVDNAFTTRSAVAADDGEDFEDILRTLAEEQRLADQYGIKLISTERPASAGQPPAQPEPTSDNSGQGDDGN
jgi:lambda family phage portal protein